MIRLALLLALLPLTAAAHTLAPQRWAGPEPWLLAPMLLAGFLYGLGWRRLSRKRRNDRLGYPIWPFARG